MTATKIGDIVIPANWNNYVIDRSVEKSALFSSGIVEQDGRIAVGGRSGGESVNMPYFKDLTGDEEELSDQRSLTVNRIETGQDMAVLQAVGKAWGSNDLAASLSGEDPMAAIGNLVGDWWARVMQKRLLSTLSGVFASASMAGNIFDNAVNVIDQFSMIDAEARLGDAGAGLTAIAVHSATYYKLKRLELVITQTGKDGADFETYQGKRLIIDDTMPVTAGVYTSYLFGSGAFGFSEGAPKVPVETDRNSLAGEDVLINRRHFVLHPRGVKWVGTSLVSSGDATGGRPNRTDLSTASNWSRIYDPKNIRIVAMTHKVA